MATVNPIRNSNLASNGIRLSQMISQEVNLLLKDAANLRNSGLLSYQGSINGLGSDTVRVRLAGLDGFDKMEGAGNEISDESGNAQDLTIQTADIQAARQFIIYEISDLAGMTSFGTANDIDPFRLARSMSGSYEARFAEMTGEAAASFTTTAGSNTTTLSVDDFFDAIFELEQAGFGTGTAGGAPGPYACVLAPKALTELQDSLRNETGNAISRMQSSMDMLQAKGENYKGQLFGVDVYSSALVKQNASSGYDNYMISPMALGFVDGIPMSVRGASDLMEMGKIVVEFDRHPMKASTYVVGHAYLGISIIEDSRGVKLLSAR